MKDSSQWSVIMLLYKCGQYICLSSNYNVVVSDKILLTFYNIKYEIYTLKCK